MLGVSPKGKVEILPFGKLSSLSRNVKKQLSGKDVYPQNAFELLTEIHKKRFADDKPFFMLLSSSALLFRHNLAKTYDLKNEVKTFLFESFLNEIPRLSKRDGLLKIVMSFGVNDVMLILHKKELINRIRTFYYFALAGDADYVGILGAYISQYETLFGPADFNCADCAKQWLEKAANLGNVRAIVTMGNKAFHVEDFDTANAWYEKAVRLGDEATMFNLALGFEKKQDFEQAKKWYLKAARKGFASAMLNLSVLFRQSGHYGKAFQWIQKAENTGRHEGFFLQRLYSVKASVYYLMQEKEKALMCYEKAIDVGDGDAKFFYAWLSYEQEKVNETVISYFQGCQEKHTRALDFLGLIYKKKNDVKAAEQYFRLAIEKGYTHSKLGLAEILSDDQKEEKEALYLDCIDDGCEDAEILYANFLFQQGRIEDAKIYGWEYGESQDVNDQSHNEDLNGENINSENTKRENAETDFSTKNQGSNVKDVAIGTATGIDSKQVISQKPIQSSAHMSGDSIPTYKPPEPSKAFLKMLKRAQKQKRSVKDFESERQTQNLNFSNVTIHAHEEAVPEIRFFSHKVKGLLSCLANAETNRADFEELTNHKGVYSMRLTQTDRLVFTIDAGNTKTGVTSVKILSAKGHYKTLKKRVKASHFAPFSFS